MLVLLTEAFLLGLSMGPVCLGYCAPVFVPLVAVQKQSGWSGTAKTAGLFLLGRLAGYSLVGVAAGLLGTMLTQSFSTPIWGAVRIGMGILLIVFGVVSDPADTGMCPGRRQTGTTSWFALTLGLLTGLNLCPPFGAAIAAAAAAASIPNALFYFWAFFAGTAVYFVPFLFFGPLTGKEALRQIARICLWLAGLWLLVEGIVAILSARGLPAA